MVPVPFVQTQAENPLVFPRKTFRIWQKPRATAVLDEWVSRRLAVPHEART